MIYFTESRRQKGRRFVVWNENEVVGFIRMRSDGTWVAVLDDAYFGYRNEDFTDLEAAKEWIIRSFERLRDEADRLIEGEERVKRMRLDIPRPSPG